MRSGQSSIAPLKMIGSVILLLALAAIVYIALINPQFLNTLSCNIGSAVSNMEVLDRLGLLSGLGC